MVSGLYYRTSKNSISILKVNFKTDENINEPGTGSQAVGKAGKIASGN
jgi:hypothetical protein